MAITLWHINRDELIVESCSAPCVLGLSAGDHFTTEFAAQCELGELQEKQETQKAKRSTTARKNNKTNADGHKIAQWASPDDIRSYAGLNDEVYVHPQGKFAVITLFGSMAVYKGNRAAKTGGSVADIRSGRGSWVLAKAAGDYLRSDTYEKRFPRGDQ